MICPKCNSEINIKDGIVRGLQRYLCKSCRYRYTINDKLHLPNRSLLTRRVAQLYIEGLSYRSIAKILGVSHTTVASLLVGVVEYLKLFRKETPSIVSEIDDLSTFKTNNIYKSKALVFSFEQETVYIKVK